MKIYAMKSNYLFPNRYRKLGMFVLIPTAILGLLATISDFTPAILEVNMPTLFTKEFFGETKFFGMVTTNLMNEIIAVLLILSSIIVAFSKEKIEDEFVQKIRLESLVWAVYVNYGILFISILFVYDLSFYWIMLFNMFTVLLFFIIRFHWVQAKHHNSVAHEE